VLLSFGRVWRSLPSLTPETKAFAPASCRQNTTTKEGSLRVNGKSWYVLDSSFILRRFSLQHVLHDPDFGALAAIYVGCEVEQFSVLSRARGVEQIFHHGQSAAVVLNHPCQKQAVEFRAFRLPDRLRLLGGKHPGHKRHRRVRHIHLV